MLPISQFAFNICSKQLYNPCVCAVFFLGGVVLLSGISFRRSLALVLIIMGQAAVWDRDSIRDFDPFAVLSQAPRYFELHAACVD